MSSQEVLFRHGEHATTQLRKTIAWGFGDSRTKGFQLRCASDKGFVHHTDVSLTLLQLMGKSTKWII